MTFQIFQLQEAKKKGVKKGVYRDYIVQVRSRKDGKPVSQKAAEHIKKVAKAQATVEARATPDSQEGESVSPSPFAEVAAIHAEIGTPDPAGRVPGLGFGARPTQLFTSSGSRGTQGYSPASSGATQHARQQEDRLRARELELAEREARVKADEDRLAREYEARRQSLTGARSLSANKRSSLGRRSGGGRNAVKPPHHVFVADADALQRMKMRMRMRIV